MLPDDLVRPGVHADHSRGKKLVGNVSGCMRPRGSRGDPEHYAGMQRLADLVYQYKNNRSYKFPVWFKEFDVIGVEEDELVAQIV